MIPRDGVRSSSVFPRRRAQEAAGCGIGERCKGGIKKSVKAAQIKQVHLGDEG